MNDLMKEALKKKRLQGLDITITVQPPPDTDEEEDEGELAPTVKDAVEETDNDEALAASKKAATTDLEDAEEMPEESMQGLSDEDKMARVDEVTGNATTGGGGLAKKVARHWISKMKLNK